LLISHFELVPIGILVVVNVVGDLAYETRNRSFLVCLAKTKEAGTISQAIPKNDARYRLEFEEQTLSGKCTVVA